MTESITQEHVVPKWLQSKFDLRNAKLELLNGTSIPYKQLRIPCCAKCNNGSLSALEATISRALADGYQSAVLIDQHLWYLWAGKIYYGILRKELTLLKERHNPDAGSIVEEGGLKSFESLHLFLQGIRGKHEFVDTPPFSVLICNLHDLGRPRSFSLRDNLAYMTLSVRMGDVGLIVCFEDHRLTDESYGRYVRDVNHRKLHPIQFDELFARATYQVSLIETPIKYLTEFDTEGNRRARTTVVGGYRLRDRSNKELSVVMKAHVAQWVKKPLEGDVQWYVPPGLVPTWMTDDDGNLLLRSLPEWKAEAKLDA